ncbi:hypothetical protein RHMOL_Rhmol06G0083200 [Rhododendron molle]|uniref:Uncharacterized protein n=1 Tax=Rhododendron molle TaxID=49168 RepID=A0ACC0NBA7_RHOML|nr:hypothetical protein RHMOL_Rhmol06G0083200 [Rhododendron molle]
MGENDVRFTEEWSDSTSLGTRVAWSLHMPTVLSEVAVEDSNSNILSPKAIADGFFRQTERERERERERRCGGEIGS